MTAKWISYLEEEDIAFIKKFILASGSLKEMAKIYGVSYPTVRLRLDKLIQKIEQAEKPEEDSYIETIKKMVFDDQLTFETAKFLINEYKKSKEEMEHGSGDQRKLDIYFFYYCYWFGLGIGLRAIFAEKAVKIQLSGSGIFLTISGWTHSAVASVWKQSGLYGVGGYLFIYAIYSSRVVLLYREKEIEWQETKW